VILLAPGSRRLREEAIRVRTSARPPVPIVCLSTRPREAALEPQGTVAYLTKPFHADDLVAVLRAAAGVGQQRQAS
jgi:CheY-like chemotaxis protein